MGRDVTIACVAICEIVTFFFQVFLKKCFIYLESLRFDFTALSDEALDLGNQRTPNGTEAPAPMKQMDRAIFLPTIPHFESVVDRVIKLKTDCWTYRVTAPRYRSLGGRGHGPGVFSRTPMVRSPLTLQTEREVDCSFNGFQLLLVQAGDALLNLALGDSVNGVKVCNRHPWQPVRWAEWHLRGYTPDPGWLRAQL